MMKHSQVNPHIHFTFHFFSTCAYTFTILHFLHTLFRNPKTPPHHHSSLLKCLKKKKRKRSKVKRKREIRSYKKENKWEHLLPLSLLLLSSPSSTISIIIHLTWEYNHHKWYLLLILSSTLFYQHICF